MCISDKHNLKPSPIVCLQRLIRRNHWSCTDQERHQRVEQIISKLISRYQEKNWSQRPLMAAVIGGRSGRHRRPWWPSSAAVVAVIRGRVAVIGGRGGRQRPGWPSVRPGWPSGQPGWPSVARVAVSNSPGGCLQQPVWPSAAAWVAACSSRCGHQLGQVAVSSGQGWPSAAAWVAACSSRCGRQQQPGWLSAAACVAICWAMVAISSSRGGHLQQPVWPSAAAWVAVCSSLCGHLQQPGWLSAAARVAICWAMVAISSSRGGHLQQPGWLSAAASKSIFQESRRHGGDLIRLVNQTNVAGITHYQSGGATWHANVPNLICRSRHLPDNYS